AYSMLGHFALAEHHSACATAFWDRLQNNPGKIHHLIVQANLQWDQGNVDEAERFLQQALTLTRSAVHLRCWRGYTLVNLSEFYRDQGRYNSSIEPAEEGLALARQLGDRYLLNYALMTLALIYLYMGDAATANLLIAEMSLAEEPEASTPSYQQVLRDLALGTIWVHQQRYTEAGVILAAAEAALHTMGIKREQLKALVRLAACHLGQRQPTKAFERLAAVKQILTTVNGYKQRVGAEVRIFPFLQQAIEKQPGKVSLSVFLSQKPDEQVAAFQGIEGKVVLSAAAIFPRILPRMPGNSPRLKILALGEPAVLLDEQPITHWRMARAMELCFYLLSCEQPLRKEQILAAMWDKMDAHVYQTFYSTIHYLRKALGGERVITSKAGVYTLDLASIYGEAEVWYDVTVFKKQYTLGKQALVEEAHETARAAFENMVELYRGDYVQPFYSNWCILRRDELRRLYLDARQQLARLAWQNENVEESITHWQQMLAVDVCQEEAHCGLMQCYIRQGRPGLALQQYQRCAEMLQQEWGAVPGIAVQNLYRQLMESPKAAASLSW
ncbi:MAG: BTAD domain-containing putative transcriptional regulator, partial [Ktedonobacteraceae bacterium]